MTHYIELNGKKRRLTLDPSPEANGYRCELDGQPYSADIQLLQPNVLSLLIEGKSYRILFDPRLEQTAVTMGERRIPYRIDDPRSLRSRADAGANDTGARSIMASMPGRIVRILVKVGDNVEAQQGLIVVEAMKMQNELKAPGSGRVTRVPVEVGATVQAGKVLMVIE